MIHKKIELISEVILINMALGNYIIIKYSIIYVIFILGISMISEWLCSDSERKLRDNSRTKALKNYERTLDKKLSVIKQEYLNKAKMAIDKGELLHLGPNKMEHFSSDTAMSSPPVGIALGVDAKEEYIVSQTAKKLNALRNSQTAPVSFFSTVPRQTSWNPVPKVTIEPTDIYSVGGYQYTPSQVTHVDPYSDYYTIYK